MKGSPRNYDYSFKILLAGDSGVGKSSLLLSFISDFVHDLTPTIGTTIITTFSSPICFSSFMFSLKFMTMVTFSSTYLGSSSCEILVYCLSCCKLCELQWWHALIFLSVSLLALYVKSLISNDH